MLRMGNLNGAIGREEGRIYISLRSIEKLKKASKVWFVRVDDQFFPTWNLAVVGAFYVECWSNQLKTANILVGQRMETLALHLSYYTQIDKEFTL